MPCNSYILSSFFTCVLVVYCPSCRKADKVLEIVSEDTSSLRKHKIAYGMLFHLSTVSRYLLPLSLPLFPTPSHFTTSTMSCYIHVYTCTCMHSFSVSLFAADSEWHGVWCDCSSSCICQHPQAEWRSSCGWGQ